MEPAIVIADVTTVEQGAQRVIAPPCGRFSTGIERMPDALGNLRVGRFSDGIEQRPDGPHRAGLGRFSTGVERFPDASERSRVGSFADSTFRPARYR